MTQELTVAEIRAGHIINFPHKADGSFFFGRAKFTVKSVTNHGSETTITEERGWSITRSNTTPVTIHNIKPTKRKHQK